jgi:hypothetical protein
MGVLIERFCGCIDPTDDAGRWLAMEIDPVFPGPCWRHFGLVGATLFGSLCARETPGATLWLTGHLPVGNADMIWDSDTPRTARAMGSNSGSLAERWMVRCTWVRLFPGARAAAGEEDSIS